MNADEIILSVTEDCIARATKGRCVADPCPIEVAIADATPGSFNIVAGYDEIRWETADGVEWAAETPQAAAVFMKTFDFLNPVFPLTITLKPEPRACGCPADEAVGVLV